MVDFENETTITRPRRDILVMILLQRNYNIMEALEKYYQQKLNNTVPVVEPTLKARIRVLFHEVEIQLKEWNKDKYERIKPLIGSEKIDDILKGYLEVREYLTSINILKFAEKRPYDSGDPLQEDEAKEL